MTRVAAAAATILVVNDDPIQLRQAERILDRHGYRVTRARSADEALELLDQDPSIAGIVTDLHMPGIDGWRFCRLLRSPEFRAYNTIPILVVSATYSGDDAESLTTELGAHGFLPAPYEATVLLARVRDMLCGATPPQTLEVLLAMSDTAACDQLRLAFHAHGYDVSVARTYLQAWERYRRDEPGIVILDGELPDGGPDAFLALVERPLRRTAVLVTGTESRADGALRAVRAGADQFVGAPFDPEYVVALAARSRRARALLRVEALLEERTRRLRDSEARLRAILRAMPDMLLVYTPNGEILHANRAAADHLEYAVTYLPGRPILELVAPAHRVELERQLGTTRNGSAYRYKTVYRTASGKPLPVEVTEHRLQFGGRDAIVGTMRNLTECLPIDEERALLHAALEQTGEVFLVTGVDGSIRYANHAFEIVTGYTRAEAIGQSVKMLRAESEPWRTMIRTLERGEAWSGRMQRSRKDGETYVSESTITPVVDDRGAVTSFVAVERDVSHESEMQATLLQAQKMEAVGTLAGGIAHDFNNLLTGILGYASLLRRLVPSDGELGQMVDVIESSAARAAQLTQQLLGFARRGKNRNVPVDVNRIVHAVVKLLSRTIDKRIELTMSLSRDGVCVHGDPAQLEQAVLNLALNARDAVEDQADPHLAFRTGLFDMDAAYCASHPGAQPGRYVLLELEDNGCGISPDVIERVFEPFFTTKPPGKGTGMGLSMVYGIVKSHSGTIRTTSELDEGTTFRMYLPVVEDEPEDEPKTRSKLQYGTGRILLVDDESVIRDTASSMLRRLGYEVATFESGDDALTYFDHYGDTVQLAIIDMIMPGMDGGTLIQKLLATRSDLPILLSTGYGLNDAAQRILDSGATAFVRKPYDWSEFSLVVAQTIDPKSAAVKAD